MTFLLIAASWLLVGSILAIFAVPHILADAESVGPREADLAKNAPGIVYLAMMVAWPILVVMLVAGFVWDFFAGASDA